MQKQSNPELRLGEHLLGTYRTDFAKLKAMADKAIGQLPEGGLRWRPDPESNSIAVIMNHMAGNMRSRFTGFLDSDGEKPDRNRDAEFEETGWTDEELLERWEGGWETLLGALSRLREEDLLRTVTIRGEAHTAVQALQRQLSHYGTHVGQIVYAAKAFMQDKWQTLSIPKGGSQAFNRTMHTKHQT